MPRLQGQMITRDSVPAVDPSQPRTARSWEWVCSALVNKDKGECVVDLVETVFMQKEQIWSWFYSSNGGIIRKKAQRKLTVANVVQKFAQVAEAYDHNAAKYIAVCWLEDQRRLQLLPTSELQALLAKCPSAACLSAFVRPRGELDPTRYANLEHEFTLSKIGKAQCKLYRLAMGDQKILSMDPALNNTANELIQSAVSFIEKSRKCRVVQCVSYLVLDEFGRVYLWRTESCQTMSLTGSVSSTSVNAVVEKIGAYEGPHAVNERILARAKADASKNPDERLIQAILASPTPQRKRSTLLLGSSASQPFLPSQSVPKPTGSGRLDPLADDFLNNSRHLSPHERKSRLRSAVDWDEAMQYLPPSSSLSRDRRRTISAAHLASSQRKGCCGDYCHFVLAKLTAKRLETPAQLNPPPQPQTTNPNTVSGVAIGSGRSHGTRSSSVYSATAAANAFLTTHPDDSAETSSLRKPMSPQRQQFAEAGLMMTPSSADGAKPRTIPFKLVAQTRAERQLVDLFIRRYEKGEDGDYLAEEYYGDGEPLGQTFPGYYYQQVQVCQNCFDFYTLVEGVRMRAPDQIAQRRRKSRRPSPSDRLRSSSSTPASLMTLDEDDDDHTDPHRHRRPPGQEQRERIWRRIWSTAQETLAPSLTKKDAAELYSFVNPHPAIAMVIDALGRLLLGRDLAVHELKRQVSQEKLLLSLQQCDLDELPLSRVLALTAHVRNPLFAPRHIAPVSSCAARFCDWILTTLQAYAWKHLPAFREDKAAWQLLAFLKPDLLPQDVAAQRPEDVTSGLDLDVEGPSGHRTTISRRVPGAGVGALMTTTTTTAATNARRVIQQQQMARLAAPSGSVEAAALHGVDDVFTCRDGQTQIPFTVTGQAVGGSAKCNLIVFPDFFDTMESTKVFFRAIVAKHVGARALFFNLPGQAGSRYPPVATATAMATAAANEPQSHESSPGPRVFNNVTYADLVHELLVHLQQTKRFITRGLPFHVVGFGNGANVATAFAVRYGTHAAYVDDLQSLALVNGFARVDAQLAAILHSTVNVFSCLPPTRPDLPVSFFCKYLFSDGYLAKIDVNLALSIYTAVTNPITLDGRLRICQGALHHVDLAAQLPAIAVPLVLVQSVENALVAPTNVDPFLQNRINIAHSWSHQQPATSGAAAVAAATAAGDGSLPLKTRRQLHQVLGTPHSAFVSWLRAGHELRQEAKQYLSELFEQLVCAREQRQDPDPTSSPEPRPHPVAEPSTQPSGPASATLAVIPTGSAVSVSTVSRQDVNTKEHDGKHPGVSQPPTFALSSIPVQTSLPNADQRPPPKNLPSSLPPEQVLGVVDSPEPRRRRASHESVRPSDLAPSPSATSTPALDVIVNPALSHPIGFSPPRLPPWETPHIELVRGVESSPQEKAVAVAPPPHSDELLHPQQAEQQQQQQQQQATLEREMDALRRRMRAEEERLQREAEELRERQRRAAEERMEALRQEQERRRRQWEEEDRARLAALERQLQEEQLARENERRLRERAAAEEVTSILAPLVSVASIPAAAAVALSPPSAELIAPTATAMRQQLRQVPELPSVFDQMEAEERAKKRTGVLRGDEFDDVTAAMDQNYRRHVKEHESSLRQELFRRKQTHAIRIQGQIWRFLAVQRVTRLRHEQRQLRVRRFAGGEIVRVVRGFLGRRRAIHWRETRERQHRTRAAALAIQCLFRGFVCRRSYHRLRRASKALVLQRVYRGHRGRRRCRELREEQARRRFLDRRATKLQATWRMHMAQSRFLQRRLGLLAAIEIQRLFRGYRGRVEARRKRAWREAEPGPERLALGLQMIEGSKQAFERQQSEIDALHRAQESVERQVSAIHAELQESEKELAVLERELQEIDQLEADLQELTHEAEILHQGGLEGLLRSHSESPPAAAAANSAVQPLGSGVPPAKVIPYEVGLEDHLEDRATHQRRQADAYAVEMAIQIKRAEREKKKKDLEAEFTSVFAEVQQKRRQLAEMEEKLADMEATRMRKDREFARMQRNLVELLEEQKLELENLREKGIELEAATATSAAAAAATAVKAKEHEKRSQAMFESTEELMKFQFMSMSLSYFSSLNMLKNLRDINADTTAAAITSTAETAAAAAAAAAAANIPTAMKRLQPGGAGPGNGSGGIGGTAELMLAASERQRAELERRQQEEEEARRANQQPLPDQVRLWTIDDVGRWLDSLALSQYKPAFREGAVDGEFLLELRPEDMSDVLGVVHKLHVRKLLVARNKLLPLSQQEQLQLAAVTHEEQARAAREGPGSGSSSSSPAVALDLDTVFSQARNGRLKRLIESVDAGFDINTEDDKGNTLLLLACQNVNLKMVEFLVGRRANVNHKNAQGNTPLHFAMAYDGEGKLGEYLIAHGADDTIENIYGLTAYDGLTAD